MASIGELTARYERFMLSPRFGTGVCTTCFNLTAGYECCYACAHSQAYLDVVAPISYSIAGEELHLALKNYKRRGDELAQRLTAELAAVLWQFLARHERCVARAAGTASFEIVTAVPSGDPARDERHPLRRIVAKLAGPTRDRHQRLLHRSAVDVPLHEFSAEKYAALRALDGESVLLIDDTWTTGANAQSAAAALKTAGAGPTAAVVIGRHLNRAWHENDLRLRKLARRFNWARCAQCEAEGRRGAT